MMMTLGFLSVPDWESCGLVGGLLILNQQARPLEFHCTAPVKPNRAQQILYGPTLPSYLYGELIGRTLLDKTEHKPTLIITDTPACLALREFTEIPVLLPITDTANERTTIREWRCAEFANNDRERFAALTGELPRTIDWLEPFGRIRAALDEAQRPSRAA